MQKTIRRGGTTLELGTFEAVETVHVCSAGCRDLSGGRAIRRAQALAQRIPPGAVVGYDVMAFVGLQRFVHHRQREEIRTTLREQHGVDLSSGEVSTLAGRFLDYLEALHVARAPALRGAFADDGGWPLHVDATTEHGRGTLLVAYAGWRGWAVGAWKIPTERTDAVLPRLRTLVERFGAPCAIMRDLGKAMIESCGTLAAELAPSVPVLACHQHFVCDVGKDLLAARHDRLRALFRSFDVRKNLRTLARDLGRQLGPGIAAARQDLGAWLAKSEEGHALPEGAAGLAAVRAVAQWVLDYPADGKDQGFPFDQPYLDLYRRCRRAARAADAFLRSPPADPAVSKALRRLRQAVAPTESEVPFAHTADRLTARVLLFAELRDALRLGVKPGRTASGPPAALDDKALAQFQDVEAAVDRLAESLKQRRPARGPAQDTRAAIDLIVAHIARHRAALFGHAVRLPDGRTRLVERTNNALEGFHRQIKQGERRRSGRKTLTQDFEHLPPGVALAANLTRPDYVQTLCGSLDRLATAFADLDARDRRSPISSQVRARAAAPEFSDLEAASLPTPDRKLVRAADMGRRISAAAASRAPRPRSATAL